MALFLMVSLSSYSRPSELLRCRIFSLVRPADGITRSWSLLLSPEELHARGKTGEYDSSIALDTPYLGNWAPKLFSVLKAGHPEDPLWDFNYSDYNKVMRDIVERFNLDITPYQTRHSGPSIDRSRGYRTLQEVQKRGQWKSQKSVNRYEKSARLAATWDALDTEFKIHCRECETNLGDILLGHRPAPTYVSKGLKVVT